MCFKKNRLHTFLLYKFPCETDSFICLGKFSIWQAGGRSAQQFLEALKALETYVPVLMGSCFLRLHSSSQEHFETKFSVHQSLTDFNQVCCTTSPTTVLVFWKHYLSFPPWEKRWAYRNMCFLELFLNIVLKIWSYFLRSYEELELEQIKYLLILINAIKK